MRVFAFCGVCGLTPESSATSWCKHFPQCNGMTSLPSPTFSSEQNICAWLENDGCFISFVFYVYTIGSAGFGPFAPSGNENGRISIEELGLWVFQTLLQWGFLSQSCSQPLDPQPADLGPGPREQPTKKWDSGCSQALLKPCLTNMARPAFVQRMTMSAQ